MSQALEFSQRDDGGGGGAPQPPPPPAAAAPPPLPIARFPVQKVIFDAGADAWLKYPLGFLLAVNPTARAFLLRADPAAWGYTMTQVWDCKGTVGRQAWVAMQGRTFLAVPCYDSGRIECFEVQ